MDLYRVNLNLLIALDHLLTEKSVTFAAKKLGMTQAAMSHNLQQLRDLFGDDLLVREKNHMLLTNYARELHPKLQQIIEEVRTLIVDGQRFVPEKAQRTFRLGMSDYMVALVLPKLLSLLQKHAPGIKIVIESADHLGVSEPFERGEYDLAIGKLFSPSPSVRSMPLFQDRAVCIMNPKHALAAKKTLTLSDYVQAEHIAVCLDKDRYLSSLIEQRLVELGVARNVKLALPFVSVIFKLIEGAQHLLSTVTDRMAMLYQDENRFVIKPLPFTMQNIEYCLVWHQRHENDPGHVWLRSQIKTLGRVPKL